MRIIPAILTDNPEELKAMLSQAEEFTDWVHIDIMDALFVPTRSITALHLENTKTPLNSEIHLMTKNPEKYLLPFKKAGAKRISFHYEATEDQEAIIKIGKSLNLSIGLAINPETPISAVKHLLDKIDFILFLSVNPGYYGNPFLPEVLNKIRELKSLANIETGIDGGIKGHNIKIVKESGVDFACVGSAIFQQPNPKESFLELKRLIQ